MTAFCVKYSLTRSFHQASESFCRILSVSAAGKEKMTDCFAFAREDAAELEQSDEALAVAEDVAHARKR